jgi:TonB family protein
MMTTAALLAAVMGFQLQAVGIHGVVRSSDADRPIVYAHVRVLGDSASDWTDESGDYRLDGLERGRWRIRVAHPGHDSLDFEVFVPGDRGMTLDVTLRARPGPPVDALAEFEPFRVAYTLPALLNQPEVTELIQAQYPPALVDRRIGGEAVLWLWLDERGKVARSVISSSSGQPALDSIALRVSHAMRFRPAKNREDAVRVLVQIPVLFTVPAPAQGPGQGRR